MSANKGKIAALMLAAALGGCAKQVDQCSNGANNRGSDVRQSADGKTYTAYFYQMQMAASLGPYRPHYDFKRDYAELPAARAAMNNFCDGGDPPADAVSNDPLEPENK